jgi:hypothetical protein
MQNVLGDIRKGMKVFDSTRAEIGTVDWVKFGDDDPSTPEVEAAAPAADPHPETLIDSLAEVFSPDEMPEEIRERLLQQGFVRIDANGLFSADRYVTPDQIQGVSSEGLLLNVSKSELMKRL